VKPYQAQRVDGRKPKNHNYLQGFLMDYSGDMFTAKTWATREADDGIGACALYAVGKKPGYIAIATADKDLRMLPGAHINWRQRMVTRVNPGDYDVVGLDGKQYGLKFFWLQMLMGDTADHIPGLEAVRVNNPDGTLKRFANCGEKTAEKLLADCTTNEQAGRKVIDLYLEGYPSSREWALDRFVEQACLLWMRTDAHGTLTDFATHNGHSRINHHFCKDVLAAVDRLAERVKSARQQVNSFGG
jgi:DNA polymerase-1